MHKKIITMVLIGSVVFMTLTSFTSSVVNTPSRWEPYIEGVLEYIKYVQDSEYQGESLALVPMSEKNLTYTTTYQSALTAIVLMSEGYYGRARKILDVFRDRPGGDPIPDTTVDIPGGYQQHRNAQTGDPLPEAERNDFWIGDNAWLLAALKLYKANTGANRYDDLIEQLRDWFVAIEETTPDPDLDPPDPEIYGIYAGFDKNGYWIVNPEDGRPIRHPEGSIDVYGALHGLDAQATQDSIKTWIDENVWIPGEGCFSPANSDYLPLDHIAWGYLALGEEYDCILLCGKQFHRRLFDPYWIETFEDTTYPAKWQTSLSDPGIVLNISREEFGCGNNLNINYTFKENINQYFRLFRNKDIDLHVSKQFYYSFMIKGDDSNLLFEAKFYNPEGQGYIHTFPLDFTNWRKIEIYWDDFEFFGDHNVPLEHISQIEFAVNNKNNPNASGEIKIACIKYYDNGINMPYNRFYYLFGAFRSSINLLYTDSTCHMATAYAVAGKLNQWKFYVDEITNILIPPESGNGLGYPCDLHGGVNYPGLIERDSLIIAPWFVIAARGIDPFPE